MSEPAEEGIQEVLRSAYSREQSHGREPVYQRTPLDEILQKENGSGELSVQEYTPAFLMMMGYFFSEGPHPGTVMRRVFAFAKALCPDLMLNMSLHEVGRSGVRDVATMTADPTTLAPQRRTAAGNDRMNVSVWL